MAQGNKNPRGKAIEFIQTRAQKVADEFGFELVEASFQKESRGQCICVFIDKEGGITLDDCEHYHKRLQPMLESIEYDIMEVSSPGVDRPIKTRRDFEKNRGNVVEIKLFAAQNGQKLWRGTLENMDDATVTIRDAEGVEHSFERKAVALIKPVIELEEEDFEDVPLLEDEAGEAIEILPQEE